MTLRNSFHWAEVVLCFMGSSLSVKYPKFKLAGEIIKSGDKKVGPKHIVLIQAELPGALEQPGVGSGF